MRSCFILLAILVLLALVIGVGAWVFTFAPDYFSGSPGITITVQSPGGGTAEPLPLPTLPPTQTPIPNPVAYKAEILLRARRFATALDTFYATNEKLDQVSGGMQDEAWRQEMATVLDELVASGQALGEAGPAPAEWENIQTLLAKVGPEVVLLRDNYRRGIDTGDEQALQAAGENLQTIQAILTQVEVETTQAGW